MRRSFRIAGLLRPGLAAVLLTIGKGAAFTQDSADDEDAGLARMGSPVPVFHPSEVFRRPRGPGAGD